MKFILSALLSLLFFWQGMVFASDQISTYYPPYRYVHEARDSVLVQKLHDRSDAQLRVMEAFLGKKLDVPITVVITRSDDEYYDATKGLLPEWSQAAVFLRERLIYIKIASGDDLLQSPGVLLHELAHIICYEKSHGAKLPGWLNEGLAQYLSGQRLTTHQKIVISQALQTKKIIRLTALDTLFQFSRNRAELAYAQALSAVEFLAEQHGEAKLSGLLDRLSAGQTFFQAFREEIGQDFIDFENVWYEYIFNEYRWLILLNFDNFLWFLMAMLFILALLAVRWRNHRKLRRWQKEELTVLEENGSDVCSP